MDNLGNDGQEQDPGRVTQRVPLDYADPAYVEGRHYPFHLTWRSPHGDSEDRHFDAETVALAAIEAVEFLADCPGHTGAVLGDVNGDPVDLEPPAPVDHWINYKTRKVRMGRGENQAERAVEDGFKKATPAHFVKYLALAQNGFRKNKKAGK